MKIFLMHYIQFTKRYFIIDQQIALHFENYSERLLHPLPFDATQITNPFLTSRISANHHKELGFEPIVKSLYPLMFLQFRISFSLQESIFTSEGHLWLQYKQVIQGSTQNQNNLQKNHNKTLSFFRDLFIFKCSIFIL